MLDDILVRKIALRLREAERNRAPIDILSIDYPGIDIADAYRVQQETLRLRLAEGRTVRGKKVGLTSRAMQLALGIDEPDFGVLLDDMFYEDGADIPASRFIEPRVEAELAFVMKKPLSDPRCTIDDVLDATDYLCPALEILDARVRRTDPQRRGARKVMDTIADNAGNAALVVGSGRIDPAMPDLRWIPALAYLNGKIEETGVAAGVLDHPANGIVWLVRRLSEFGQGVEAGETILSGSFIRPIDAAAGDLFEANFGAHGCVSCRFV